MPNQRAIAETVGAVSECRVNRKPCSFPVGHRVRVFEPWWLGVWRDQRFYQERAPHFLTRIDIATVNCSVGAQAANGPYWRPRNPRGLNLIV